MIPGKRYKPEDILVMAWRRRWVIVLPFVLAGVGTALWVRQLPDLYRSEASILVVPPQIPTKIIRTTITESLGTRIQAVKEQILSRPTLEAIITEFDLYPEERRTRLMDDVVAKMRQNVMVGGARRKGTKRVETMTFPVSFQSENPRTAMLVAERLASLVVRQNLESRATRTDTTVQFLQRQLDDARKRLQEHEARVQAFYKANGGRQGTDGQTTLGLLQSTQQHLNAVTESINRDRDRQLRLERTIADEMAISAANVTVPGGGGGNAKKPQTIAEQLEVARVELKTLELKLTPEHPDVRTAKRQLQELEKKAATAALEQPLSGGASAVAAGDVARQKRLASLRAEIDSLERRINAQRAQAQKMQEQITGYRARLSTAPALEAQIAQFNRDYEILQANYNALLRKSEDAKMAVTLEESQVSEQFQIVESARLPTAPTSPDRVRLNLMGVLAGLAFGLGFAALLEYRDTTLRSEDDVVAALALPVVALVPTMLTPLDRERRRKRRLLMASSAVVVVTIAVVVLVMRTRLLAWVM